MRPRFSVIVPAHDAAASLGRCLAAIEGDGFARDAMEIIVVDDASTDDTPQLAAQYADALVRLPDVPRGPAYARNRGADAAHGEVLLFVDADVVLAPGTLALIDRYFEANADVAAVIGRYDAAGCLEDLPSAYHDGRWAYLHTAAAGEVASFWGACGAVRASVFEEAGRFNEWNFSAPPAEDVEFGRRLHARGRRIVLLPAIAVVHLRRWSLRDLLVRDCWQRGVRVARLLSDTTIRPRPVHRAGLRDRVSLELLTAALALVVAVGAIAGGRVVNAAVLAGLAVLLILELPFLGYLARTIGPVRTLLVLPLHVACAAATGAGLVTGWLLSHLVGAPRPDPTVEALAEVGVRTWPPLPVRP